MLDDFKQTKYFKSFVEDPSVIAILLTGSQVLGTSIDESDHDIIIVYNQPIETFKYREITGRRELYDNPFIKSGNINIDLIFVNINSLLSSEIYSAYSWMNILPFTKEILYSTETFDRFFVWCETNEDLFLDYNLVSAAHFYLNQECLYKRDSKNINTILFYNKRFGIYTDFEKLKKYKESNSFPEDFIKSYKTKVIEFAKENYSYELEHFKEFTEKMNEEIRRIVHGND